MKTYFYILALIMLVTPLTLSGQTSYANYLNSHLQQKYQLTGGSWIYGQDEQINLMKLSHVSNAYCNSNWSNNPDAVFGEMFTKKRNLSQTCIDGSNPWDSVFKLPESINANEGDLFLIVFWAKNANTLSSKKAAIHWEQKHTVEGIEKRSKLRFTNFTNEWEQYIVPFRGSAGNNTIIGHLGFKDQNLMIGGFTIIRFPGAADSVDFSDFHEGTTYAGINGSQSWINTANQGIYANRMKNFNFDIKDANGNPINGAEITIEQLESEFTWGTSDKGILLDNPNYQNYFGNLFNSFSFESDLLWDNWEIPKSYNLDHNTGNHNELKSATDWVVSKKYKTRLHNLLWPSRNHIPPTITGDNHSTDFSKNEFTSRLNQHITNILGNTDIKRNLSDIDVLNEPTLNRWVQCDDILHDCSNSIGFDGAMDIYASAFDRAKELAPNATLYLNEYVAMDMGDYQVHGSNRMKQIIDQINQRSNIGVEAIGLQSHMKYAVPPQTVLNILDDFGDYADKIKITEFDMVGLKDDIKPNYLKDFMTAIFSHEKVIGFQMWGFIDYPNQSERLLYYENGSPKQALLDTYTKLTQDDWWTDAVVYTNANGLNTTRAFKGEHKIRITKNGTVLYDEVVTLSKNDVQIKIGGTPSENTCEQLQNPNFDSSNNSFEVAVFDGANAYHYHNNNSPKYDRVVINNGKNSMWKVQLRQSGVTLEQGANYTLKMRVKADANKPIYFNMRNVANNQAYGQKSVTVTTSWQEFEHTFTMNSATDENAQLTIGVGKNNANISFDYISLVKNNCSPEICNQIINGDYSNGLDNWNHWVNPNSQADAQFYSYNGSAFINIDNIGNNLWDVQHMQTNLEIESDKQYTIKFDARATGNRSMVVDISQASPYDGYFYSTEQLSTQWQTYEITFDPQQDQNTSNGQLLFHLGGSTLDVFIDNLELLSICSDNNRLPQSQSQSQPQEIEALAYPNPFKNQLRIDLSNLENSSGQISLYDLQGKLIMEQPFQEKQELLLDTHSLNTGIYFLKVRSNFAEKTIKVIKE